MPELTLYDNRVKKPEGELPQIEIELSGSRIVTMTRAEIEKTIKGDKREGIHAHQLVYAIEQKVPAEEIDLITGIKVLELGGYFIYSSLAEFSRVVSDALKRTGGNS